MDSSTYLLTTYLLTIEKHLTMSGRFDTSKVDPETNLQIITENNTNETTPVNAQPSANGEEFDVDLDQVEDIARLRKLAMEWREGLRQATELGLGLLEQNNELTAKVESQAATIETQNTTIETQKTTIGSHETTIETQQGTIEQLQKKLLAEETGGPNYVPRNLYDQTRNRRDTLITSNRELAESLEKAQNELSQSELLCDKRDRENRTLREANTELSEANDDLKRQLEENASASERAAKLAAINAELKKHLDQGEVVWQRSQTKISELEEQLQQTDNRHQNEKRKLTRESTEKIRELTDKNVQLLETFERATKKIQLLNETNDGLGRALKTLRNENEQLRSALIEESKSAQRIGQVLQGSKADCDRRIAEIAARYRSSSETGSASVQGSE